MSCSKEQTPGSTKSFTIISALDVMVHGIPIPNKTDFLQLADELKQNPPPNLTPESLSVVIWVLGGGEEPHLAGEQTSNNLGK